ncbi:MAG: hypothetical protein DMF04_13050 [Verrucomicrobia bacterium]|nr:MAG: hypothetical protein DMF04_13050 [Verrucomicrobiota bacterium]
MGSIPSAGSSALARKTVEHTIIDLADYLHSGRNFIVACTEFPKFLHDTSTLESSQRLDHSHIESTRILDRSIGLPKTSADADF